MPTLSISTEKAKYNITLEDRSLRRVGELFDLDRRVLILTDDGVPTRYVRAAEEYCRKASVLCLPAGEIHKDVEHYIGILSAMADFNMDRKDCLVSIGGGVVGDMGGFAAATYMRGIDYYNIPTTLLSQVDSSIGGKTAVDFKGYKNLVGAFWQPKGVIIDPEVLETLNERQFSCGMAEIIKMFATSDGEMFERLEKSAGNIREDKILLRNSMTRGLKVKKEVVEQDARESGIRKILNFGHTVGHGIESVTGLYHGECVAMGMLCVTGGEIRERIRKILEKYSLPTSCRIPEKELAEALRHDKKTDGDEITVVRVDKIGACRQENTTVERLIEESREVLELV